MAQLFAGLEFGDALKFKGTACVNAVSSLFKGNPHEKIPIHSGCAFVLELDLRHCRAGRLDE
jgi:hypothetical protein